jgi:hypothetical protein
MNDEQIRIRKEAVVAYLKYQDTDIQVRAVRVSAPDGQTASANKNVPTNILPATVINFP